MRTEGGNKAVAFSAIVFILFGGYFSYAAFVSGQPSSLPFIQSIAAKDGEEEDEEDEHEDEDEDEDENEDDNSGKDEDEDENEDEDDAAEEAREAAKDKAEWEREQAKKTAERERESGKQVAELDDDLEDEFEIENEEEDERSGRGDEEAMFKDREKTLAEVTKKINEAEEEILEKQSEGVDVSAALAQLALAKAKLADLDAAFTANELDRIKSLAKEAERLAHFARGKTLHDSEDVAKDIADVAKRIAQTKEKITLLARYGGDVSGYEASLAGAEADFALAQSQIAAGGSSLLAGLSALEVVERRVKSIKNGVEGALLALGATDDDDAFEREHEDEVEDATSDISEMAEIDDDGMQALSSLAVSHQAEAEKVTTLVMSLDERNRILRGLFGYDMDTLNALRNEVAINESRIAAMQEAADAVEDNELNRLINERISDLRTENTKLVGLINAKENVTGVFGWFFRLMEENGAR